MCTMHMRLCIYSMILSQINTLSISFRKIIKAICFAITGYHLLLFPSGTCFCASGTMFVKENRLTPSPEAMAPREGVSAEGC
jgi:hypothetical protein